MIRLGVNVDHVATLRNARGGDHPDPIRAALAAQEAGADGITAHLREDRRHIKDDDIKNLKNSIALPLNMEMAPLDEMADIALAVRPHACCLVPEKRAELTTEGGLNIAGDHNRLAGLIARLSKGGVRVSLFIDPNKDQINAATQTGAQIIELHTGAYCDACENRESARAEHELNLLIEAAKLGHKRGFEVHAGHGISLATLPQIARLPHLAEVNIGHFIFGEAIFTGLADVIGKMKAILIK